jgi:hypothetical protein
MCQWILNDNGKVVPRRSVRPLQTAEIHSPSELKKRQVFGEWIERRHGTSINPPKPKVQEHEFSEEIESEYSEKVDFDKNDDQASHEVPDTESTILLKEIIGFGKDDSAVPVEDKYLTTRSGQRRLRKTTQGWELLVAWKDGTESWVVLATLKYSYPVELAEYAKARGIDNKPAFAWWVPNTTRRRNSILSAVTARFQKKTHKFGN